MPLTIMSQVDCILECARRVSDMGSKLLFRFRLGTHGQNEELGGHSTKILSARSFCKVSLIWVLSFVLL